MSTAGMNFIRSAAAAASSELERRQPMAGASGKRFAGFSPNSYDADNRSVEAILSVGAAVQRLFYVEELAITGEAIDLTRAAAGLVPLLDAHNRFETDAVLGTVSNVRVADGRLLATLTFGETDRAQQVEGMVARGEIRGISIGYNITAWEKRSGASPDDLETWLATKWELLEVSLVPVPADVLTGIRSADCQFPEFSEEEQDMFIRNAPSGAAAAAPAQPQAAASRFNSTQAIDFIRMARDFGVETAAEELVRRNESGEIGTEAAREALLRAAAERQRADVSGLHGSGIVTERGAQTFDNPAFHARAVEDALYSRLSGKAPNDAAREFRGLSMVALASEMLVRSGTRDVHRMTPDQVLTAAAWNSGTRSLGGLHTTSDFPELLTAAGNRYLLDQFGAASTVIKTVSRERSANDFRDISGLQLSAFGTLPEVVEAGEIKHGTFQSRAETYKVKTFAKIFGLSRQAIINDDLDAFGRSATIMARAAAETEAQLFAELINDNPVMADSVALFHATHGNLAGAGAGPDVTTLDAGRLAMRSQKDLDGTTPLAAAPRYILASPKRETAIEQLLVATVAPTTADDTNPFNGKLAPLIDPRLDADPWYLFADPAMVPVLEHAYLRGKSGPTVEMKDGWNVLGQEFRVYMDFGAGVVDHRGAFKNPGA
ncbi:prohead protease/major capsid protein fusion protein [Sphingomonas segetis]|jgi:HK97 family phage prohead protease|uniref:prohead protease/major capsid protein fusion protein n=1 Tax=Sphingomonas segetis TaxID=1104779 RepID=UPI0012D323A0|nr:prohead protease/major capsid protein fusion protein [Sphingomonas segetis]